MTTPAAIRLDARLDGEPSRGLWLIKWLLLIPHFIVLSFLWLAFTVLTVIAFFAILITERYPKSIFDFNVGVLRWTWRVWFYGYGALGTDRYPPFSLGAEPDYPATLDVTYPQRLSRGLVLVKWWLLALPHYLVVAFFTGSGFVLWRFGGGLITLLALIAGVAVLFTTRYPRDIFDLVTGMDRWVFRVGVYTALMTDAYPPFRMDLGGADPAGPSDQEPPRPESGSSPSGWTGGRVAGVVIGALLLVTGLGAAAGGGGLLWLDTAGRDADGYLTTAEEQHTDNGYALRFDVTDVIDRDAGWPGDADWLGEVRVRASGSGTDPLFVGIGRTEDVTRYLAGVPYGRFAGRHPGMVQAMRLAMSRPPAEPAEQGFWVAASSGVTPLSLTWDSQPGDWSLVVLNTDASPGISADLDFGARVPALGPIAFSVLGCGAVLLIGGAVLVAVTARPRHVR